MDISAPTSWNSPDAHGVPMRWVEGEGVHQPFGYPDFMYFWALILALKERRDIMGKSTDQDIFKLDYKSFMFWYGRHPYGWSSPIDYFAQFDTIFSETFAYGYGGHNNGYWSVGNAPDSPDITSVNMCAQVAGYTDTPDPYPYTWKWGGEPYRTFIVLPTYHNLNTGIYDLTGTIMTFAHFTSIYLIQRYKMLNVLRYANLFTWRINGMTRDASGGGDSWYRATSDVNRNWLDSEWEPWQDGAWIPVGGDTRAFCSGHHTVQEGDPEDPEDPDVHIFSAHKERNICNYMNNRFNTDYDHEGAFWIYMQKYGDEWHVNDNGAENSWNKLNSVSRNHNSTEISSLYLNSDRAPTNCSAPLADKHYAGGCAYTSARFTAKWYTHFFTDDD